MHWAQALIFPEMEKVHQVGSNAQFQKAQLVTRAQNFYSMLSYSFLLLFKNKLACYMSIFLKVVISKKLEMNPHLLIFSSLIRGMEI